MQFNVALCKPLRRRIFYSGGWVGARVSGVGFKSFQSSAAKID